MPLPDRPSLEFLKKLAKDRLPEMRRATPSARLADAQLAVAREHGFPSWRALRAELHRRLAAAEPDQAIQLFAAIRGGEGPVVDRLLAAHPDLANARDEEGSTPLLAAVDAHRAALIPLLLRRGGDPHLVYAHSAHTPLSWAVVIEAYDCARALMEAGVEPDLFCAAGLGEVDRMRAFFTPDGPLRPRASITGSSRYTPDGTRLPCPPETDREIVSDALYMAARNGQVDTARELLAHGPDLSFRAFAGATALHWAHFAGAPRVVALLLAAGADPTLRDPVLGCTPEAFGVCTPASWAWGSKVRQRLAENPGLVHAESTRGGPLHEAAWAGALEAVKLLLEAGADPARRNAEGKTALDLARERPDQPWCVKVAEWLTSSAPEPRR
ncbi:MAG TPA: ankyrin repeat domain-containing protein, partial [Candidatus Dormibacteraeota bacterium]|nr:ankyrin repeat domain-containing protein [Candidatus Dormibacteraeota bacterium]